MWRRSESRTFIPASLRQAHSLCFVCHDILVQLLASGEKQGVFWHSLQLRDEADLVNLEAAQDIFDWLEATGRTKDRAEVLRMIVFPALLSDFLHFIYEALDTARKAKLTVTYSLLRKPLQEILYVFETMLVDLDRFGKLMVENPSLLHSQSAGGIEVHRSRVNHVLSILNETDRFDGGYIAQLRYDKAADDGFDGVCNKAIHLFTSHSVIRTEPLNINFIFSGWDAKLTQWRYLYSRLPYLLSYARLLIERLCSTFAKAWPNYEEDMERRVSAGILLWGSSTSGEYLNPSLTKFIDATHSRLVRHCCDSGFPEPRAKHLLRMFTTGAFPGEPAFMVKLHSWKYARTARSQAM
jgi:hypothetical protein